MCVIFSSSSYDDRKNFAFVYTKQVQHILHCFMRTTNEYSGENYVS